MSETTIKNHAAFIWSVADLLRGDYKQSEYGKVILPLTVLRRLDCVLEPTKEAVLTRAAQLEGKVDNIDPILEQVAGEGFFNTSKLDFSKLLAAPDDLADNLRHYIASFSAGARDVLDKFDFETQIARLDKSNLLYLVVSKFADVDLHPNVVSNLEMGYLYEELIRRFSELSNETAGEHFTPREVIRLMVNLLFIEDSDLLTKPGIVKTMLDPACGTGGMLSVAEDHLRTLNPNAKLAAYGQELNAETYAICRSDMMLKGQDASHIAYGNSFSEDGHKDATFDYLLANPPFGVEWKKVADVVKDEAETKGFAGRFGAGLPRINDGSFLFLQHMISKMKPVDQGGSRLAIVFNGSPLFTGAAGSGESEIRRWIIENDWLEAVIALPDQLFYNTGISTYFWIVTNRKSPERRGKVQLVDARELFVKMRKSLGEKRKQISDEQIAEIVRLYGDFTENDKVKIFPNEAFGFLRITVERPLRVRWEVTDDTLAALAADSKLAKFDDDVQSALVAEVEGWRGEAMDDASVASKRVKDLMKTLALKGKPLETAILDALVVRDADAEPITDAKGNAQPDSDLRDNENVPLPSMRVTYEADIEPRLATTEYRTAIADYMEVEVHPHVPDAWVDSDKTKVGYEIPLTRHFYAYTPPRPLAEIDAEIKQLETEIQALLAEVTE
jgi:type I restriction enzyme M protein